MHQIALTESQKNVVRRYVEVWRRWRPGIRAFAELETDMENGSEILVDGISVDNTLGFPVIATDARDQRFHAAIFDADDDAVDDMTSEELEQIRRYILDGNGVLPVRKWRRPRAIGASVLTPVPSTAQASYAQD
jgi:hypothetical protein